MPKSDKTFLPVRRRSLLLGLLAVVGVSRAAHAAPCPAPTVLFVCPAGTVKSAIARETLKRRAAQLGVPVRAVSRGINPEDHVSPGLAASLKADGIDPAREPVRAFAPGDAAASDIVVAFDQAAQAPGLQGARVWRTPSWNTDYAGARAATANQVDELLAELRRRPCAAAKKSAR
jgi:protein-tyrosine-phosphatase